MTKTLLDYLPLWALVFATVALVLASIEAGVLTALRRRGAGTKESAGPIGSAVGGTLGLLAFILAFTFQLAASRFEERRQLLLTEVNALGTCYLRAQMMAEPQGAEVRSRLREYVHLRTTVLPDLAALNDTLARSETLQDEMWQQAVVVAKADPNSEVNSLFVASLNEVIDLHTKRVTVLNFRIPTIVWLSLYVVSMLSMFGVGYQFGVAGGRDLAISLLLGLAFSIILGLIADLDRTSEGYLRVNQQPMLELDEKLQRSP
jgi:hypothetical protein